jgi:hypothetical protein
MNASTIDFETSLKDLEALEELEEEINTLEVFANGV